MFEIQIVTIDPSKARVLLALNQDNRTIDAARVRGYGLDMAEDRWRLDGNPIHVLVSAVDKTPIRLLNGQHRLKACVESESSFETAIVLTDDPTMMDTLDAGKSRSPGQSLDFHGIKAANSVAAMSRMIMMYDAGKVGTNSWATAHITRAVLLEFVLKHEAELITAHSFGARSRTIGSMAPAGGAWWFLASRNHDPYAVAAFAEKLVTGADLGIGDPELVLRNWIAGAGNSIRLSAAHLAAFARMWNARVLGEKPTQVKSWKPGWDFPEIL